MRLLVLHNVPHAEAAAEEQDVFTQRDAIVDALRQSGHEVTSLGCTLNLDDLQMQLVDHRPDVVWNLVEALGGTDRLVVLPVLLLESLGIPFTGSGSAALLATASKLVTKDRLRQAGLPTPDEIRMVTKRGSLELEADGIAVSPGWDVRDDSVSQGSWILKPIWEHASVGMDDDCVVSGCDREQLVQELVARQAKTGREYFAERYIAGREFNVALLNGRVLPPAEIDFTRLPAGRPRILGYRAKWDESSPEYQQTPRRFDFCSADRVLLDELTALARQCWSVFELGGHVRVDFRVDEQGQPWILEININPCLSPDAGFAAALREAGISWQSAVESIVQAALVRVPLGLSARGEEAASRPTFTP